MQFDPTQIVLLSITLAIIVCAAARLAGSRGRPQAADYDALARALLPLYLSYRENLVRAELAQRAGLDRDWRRFAALRDDAWAAMGSLGGERLATAQARAEVWRRVYATAARALAASVPRPARLRLV